MEKSEAQYIQDKHISKLGYDHPISTFRQVGHRIYQKNNKQGNVSGVFDFFTNQTTPLRITESWVTSSPRLKITHYPQEILYNKDTFLPKTAKLNKIIHRGFYSVIKDIYNNKDIFFRKYEDGNGIIAINIGTD